MTRTFTRFVPLLIVPAVLAAGCSRPQPTPDEVAGRISPPTLRSGVNPPGGVTDAPTGGAGGGSGAAGMQYQAGRYGGPPLPQPTVGAPDGNQIALQNGHRMSPNTDNAAEGDSSSGSGLAGDAGTPIPPDVPLQPRYAPGADVAPSVSATP